MSSQATPRVSTARERLLDTATELFYTEGIHAVGVDKIISQAGVTRATFYRHFPGKDDLVVAYLWGIDAAVHAIAGDEPGAPRLRALISDIADRVCSAGFRGCAFINAAAEFPDPASPVHRAVAHHRRWLSGLFIDDLAAAGHPAPESAGSHLMMLRDGAMVAGYMADGQRARARLMQFLEELLRRSDPG